VSTRMSPLEEGYSRSAKGVKRTSWTHEGVQRHDAALQYKTVACSPKTQLDSRARLATIGIEGKYYLTRDWLAAPPFSAFGGNKQFLWEDET